MKSLLKSTPQTSEDYRAWFWVVGKAYSQHRIANLCLDCRLQDRCDAELMLHLYMAWNRSATPLVKNTALATVGMSWHDAARV
jgi:hypothetical protein